VIGTTFWDLVGLAYEGELLVTAGFFKQTKDSGAEIVRIKYDREACLDILSRFVTKEPRVMQLQKELFEGRSLSEKDAAAAVDKELSVLREQENARYSDTKNQLHRILTRDVLEKAYSLKLQRRAHEEHLDKMEEQQQSLCEKVMSQKIEGEEKVLGLSYKLNKERGGHQVQRDQLQKQLCMLEANGSDE
jgi:hypothetical protein